VQSVEREPKFRRYTDMDASCASDKSVYFNGLQGVIYPRIQSSSVEPLSSPFLKCYSITFRLSEVFLMDNILENVDSTAFKGRISKTTFAETQDKLDCICQSMPGHKEA
jgi:hypothetical protein